MISRRDLLSLAGSASVAAALRSLEAFGQTAAPIKRVVLFFTPHGTVWDQWRPTGTSTAFTLPYILEPLKTFQQKLVVVDGMGIRAGGPGAPHTRGPAVLFTGSGLADDKTFARSDCSGGCNFGWNTSNSVDQEIAKRLGNVTPYKSLEFGVQTGGGFPGSYISYAAPAQPLPPKQDPYVAFQQLFGPLLEPAAQRARELTRRTDVLAVVKADLARLKPRVSKADVSRLESHTQAISELQQALQSSDLGCVPPTAPENRAQSTAGYRAWAIDRHSELLAASLACGLTRVGSLMFRPGENDGGQQGIYDFLGQTMEHHLTTHDTTAPAQQRLVEIYRWYASRFAYLLQQLDKFPEGDGTVLDHSLVVWGSEIGTGNTHSIDNIPFVLAGGGKAGVNTGRYFKYSPGIINSRLLVSLCHFMGFTDVNTFGLLDNGTGPMPGLLNGA